MLFRSIWTVELPDDPPASPWRYLTLSYRYNGSVGEAAEGAIGVSVRGDAWSRELSVRPRSGEGAVHLHPPESTAVHTVTVDADVDGFSVRSVRWESQDDGDPLRALPAGTETVLHRGPERWRDPEFELYRWSAFPSILILDSATYEIQACFLKRLAFFVEKRGFAGTIPSEAVVRDRHGWNAHDYRAEDLARFFELAREQDIALNERERQLRELLIANGVLRERNGRVTAGGGGVLGISQASYPVLRRLLLTHELFHGVFFADAAFRDECETIFQDLTDDEQEFWRLFLHAHGYNSENDYLVVNEFMAYLMQQPLERVSGYLRGIVAPRLIRWMPARADEIRSFLESYPTTFVDAAKRVGEALARITGGRPGDLRFVFSPDGQ